MKETKKDGIHVVATNRQASFRYEILEKFEAGLALVGSEVKSLRAGQINLGDSHVMDRNGELILVQAHISPYPQANQFNHAPLRPRKLLMHRAEIDRLLGKLREKGLALIPTRVYFKNGRAKCEIAVGKGKKTIDRREDIKKKTHQREIERAVRRR